MYYHHPKAGQHHFPFYLHDLGAFLIFTFGGRLQHYTGFPVCIRVLIILTFILSFSSYSTSRDISFLRDESLEIPTSSAKLSKPGTVFITITDMS